MVPRKGLTKRERKELKRLRRKPTLLGFFKPGSNAKASAVVLKSRRQRTAKRILESRGASVASKSRARKLLA